MYKIIKYLLIIPMLTLPTLVNAQNSVSFKYSQVKWDKSTFQLGAETLEFQRRDIPSPSFEYTYLFSNGLEFGLNVSVQDWKVLSDTQGSYLGNARLTNRNIVGKYNFFAGSNIRPYLGLSFGMSELHIASATRANLTGQSQNAFIGVSYNYSRRVSFNLNYQRGHLDVDDVNGIELSDNSEEWQFGIKIIIGRQ